MMVALRYLGEVKNKRLREEALLTCFSGWGSSKEASGVFQSKKVWV